MTGKKKKENKNFHIGKNIKTDNRLTSLRGEPNTNLDTYSKSNGRFRNRRKYGADGYALKDLSVGHYDHNFFDHAHDYNGVVRGAGRSLTIKEKREINKAKKKRRFWKNGR